LRKLGLFFAVLGLCAMGVAHFADALGLGRTSGVGADQLLGVLLGAGLLGLGSILLLTPSDLEDLSLPPEPRVPFLPGAPRRSSLKRRKHVRHY
jgi:hypothetical protein